MLFYTENGVVVPQCSLPFKEVSLVSYSSRVACQCIRFREAFVVVILVF